MPKTAKKKKAKISSLRKPSSKTTSSRIEFDYAPAPQTAEMLRIKKRNTLFIGGKWVEPQSKKFMASVNPATEEKIAEIAIANKKDVDRAVSAATQAHQTIWSAMSGKERGRYLFRIARLIQERARELAVLESLDGGKPIKESRDVDLPLVAAHFFYNAGWADKLDYLYPGKKVKSLGVAGQVIPWNFPLLMAAWKIAPALATGNTVVIKPAETTSLSALLLAEILQEAELPEGVVNIITGAGETGADLVSHPGIKKVAFTGSTEVGKRIMQQIGSSDKHLTLELGGKGANIIFEDAAIDQAIEGVVNGIYFNQGHVCCAGSRLLVEESVLDPVVKKLKKRISQLRIGDPLDKNTDVGAINSKTQLETIQKMVETGKKEGYEFWESDRRLPSKGYFQKPCFFNRVSSAASINRVEIFGPVLAISTFRTPEEAIQKANDTNYGLACGIWSEKGSKVHRVAGALRAGVIWANTYNKFWATSPFGGFKESGFGREGGRHGLLPYVTVEN